ncbi:hypothetical protein GIB67_000069 [Kingdonia uniflora]|uniref:Uncharacterized protein n=1 Tax=Kingdonia uniflora TaxID=39325 RepID=A0A7J7M7R0_9MAGN|nr:hypothetical protein GIB67_000069 [Kingdonia uniflora]
MVSSQPPHINLEESSTLLPDSIAQCARREREQHQRQIVTNHLLCNPMVSSQPPHIIPEESSTLLPDCVTILEEQHCTMRSPNIPYQIMYTASNFHSCTCEIGESSSPRENVIHHDVEAVYYNPIESDERNIDNEAYLHYSVSTDHRRYNLPSTDEIAVILPGDGSEISGINDIVVYRKEK